MLVAVVLCFVVVELPQGLLAFLSGIDRRIFDDVYVPLGDVWDAAVIVNSAVNFILYCTMSSEHKLQADCATENKVQRTMSSQFRQTFAEVICRRPRRQHGDGQRLRLFTCLLSYCVQYLLICERQRYQGGDGQGQPGTPMRKPQRDNDRPGVLGRWRLILRSRTAPVTSLIQCSGIFSSPERPKQPSPV